LSGVRSSAAGIAPTGSRSHHVTMKNRRTGLHRFGVVFIEEIR
jgi:hypothetical protein